jgi:hypothetical protein
MPKYWVQAFGQVMGFEVSQKVSDYLDETGNSPWTSPYGVKSRASVQQWLDDLESELPD